MQSTTLITAKARPAVGDRHLAVKALPTEDRNQLIQAVRSYLKDRSPSVRWAALDVVRDEALAELENEVLHLLSDKNGGVRSGAVECIGDFHEGETVEFPGLYPFLQDTDALVRVETLESLACIGDKKALPHMIECLGDEDSLVRSYAAISIAQLGGKKFRKQIEQASKIEKAETAKPWFARSLLLLGDWKQFSKLLDLLSSTSPTARCAAANALTAFEWSPDQLELALAAIAHAARNFLARSDQTTMESVMKQLLEDVSAPSH
jgi:HEAT repeat protein